MAQRHLSAVEVEKVHELNRPSPSKSSEVYSFWLVVQLELDWVDFDMFWLSVKYSWT